MSSFAASWDGHDLALALANGGGDSISRFEGVDVADGLPELPSTENGIERIYWPLESLLVRSFEMPLGDPRYLDESILAQEVLESAGARLDDWWLTWHAGKSGEGIAGLVFGLPVSVQKAMQASPAWQNSSALLVDGVERLSAIYKAQGNPERTAILDCDKQGLFFGYCRNGTWRGIRRLNWQSDSVKGEDRVQQVIRSLISMGFDPAEEPIYGTVDAETASALNNAFEYWHADVVEEVADRNELTLAVSGSQSGVNFRRGRWTMRDWSSIALWRRPLLLAALLMFVWVVATVSETFVLKSRAHQYEQQISAAFRAAVPNGPEVGPGYQMELLRKNAGVSVGGEERGSFLAELNELARTWSEHRWQLQEIDFRNGRMQVSGEVTTLDELEKIKTSLQAGLQKSVTIDDTKLADKSVNFRVHW